MIVPWYIAPRQELPCPAVPAAPLRELVAWVYQAVLVH